MEEDGNNIETTDDSSKLTNLGKIGWRFCNYPIRKRQDDRYGRRGTRSRILMRVANSLHVLEEPWPKKKEVLVVVVMVVRRGEID